VLTVDVESPKIATAAFCCYDKPTEKLHPERNRQKKESANAMRVFIDRGQVSRALPQASS